VSVLEIRLEPGAGAGPHVHTREDETIVVLEGRLDVEAGERRTLGAGEAVVLRRGVRHSFANPADEPMRAHFICTPGGLERFFRDVAAATSDADVAAAAERAGVVFG
jgi:quercetin dioxygenase-like cupin family protein